MSFIFLLYLLCLLGPTLAVNGIGSDDLVDLKWYPCFNDAKTLCGDLYFYANIAQENWYWYNITATNNRYYTFGDTFPCPWTFHEINQTNTFPIGIDPNGANCYEYCYMAKPPTLAPYECTPGYSPVIRVVRNQRYKLIFHNMAAMDIPVGNVLAQIQLLNTDNLFQPNSTDYYPTHTTNLHLHGSHQSGMGSFDNVLKVLFPGQCFEYIYQMQTDMAGGIHWYHPHFHGKVVFQVFGGAFGLFLQVDDPIMLRYKDPRTNAAIALPSLVQKFFTERGHERLLMAYIGFNLYMGNGNPKGYSGNFTQGQWHRLRVLHVNAEGIVMYAKFNNALRCKCEIYELAFDGVYSGPTPYNQPAYPGAPMPGAQTGVPEDSAFMFAVHGAERVEYAIRCNATGTVEYKYGVVQAGVAPGHIANFVVIPPVGVPNQVTPFLYTMNAKTNAIVNTYSSYNMVRPPAFESLLDGQIPSGSQLVAEQNVSISLNTGVNGLFFMDRWALKLPLYNMSFGPKFVQQYRIKGSGPHPTHMHVQHQQITKKGGCGFAMKYGQWYDTISNFEPGWDPINNLSIIVDSGFYNEANDCNVRWRNVDYSGIYIMHCHVLDHEDIGLTAWYEVQQTSASFESSSQYTNSSLVYNCCVPLPGICRGTHSCSKDTIGWDTCNQACKLTIQPCNANEVCLPGVDTCVPSSWVVGAKELCDAAPIPSISTPGVSSTVKSTVEQPIYPWIIMAVSIALAIVSVICAMLFVKQKTSAYNSIFLEEVKMTQRAGAQTFSTPSSGLTPTGLVVSPVISESN